MAVGVPEKCIIPPTHKAFEDATCPEHPEVVLEQKKRTLYCSECAKHGRGLWYPRRCRNTGYYFLAHTPNAFISPKHTPAYKRRMREQELRRQSAMITQIMNMDRNAHLASGTTAE